MNLCVIIALLANCCLEPDSIIRGIYVNPYQANKSAYWDKIFSMADSGFINAVVVDFKSDYGFLTYASELELPGKINAIKKHFDIATLVENTTKHNLKLIARIVCFRDNYLARHKKFGIKNDSGEIWVDKKNMAWTNPYDKGVQDYLLEITEEIVAQGVNAVAFDYVRFPTDGDVARIRLTKVKGSRVDVIAGFLEKARQEIEAEIGICVFGFSVWHPLRTEGQDIERLGEFVDVLYPMLYPSHFGRNFKNEETESWRNYWIYFDSVSEAFEQLSSAVKVIPFIQGFEYRAKNYGADYVFSQMNGVLSARGDGFIIWNARSDYSICWRALEWARNSIPMRYAQKCRGIHMRAKAR
ncbi:MAG: hypothetical protein JSV98_10290 [candidate division WOR-3 bacterium]|nr:MAG: hypothetical protein JSV98_10290 [candidate division WOR-3 bacterium]